MQKGRRAAADINGFDRSERRRERCGTHSGFPKKEIHIPLPESFLSGKGNEIAVSALLDTEGNVNVQFHKDNRPP